MKNGLFEENGELIYYKDDSPYYAGLIREKDNIYYIGHNGKAVKGKHFVHFDKTNGILKRGEYMFGEDYKLTNYNPNKSGLFEEDDHLVYYRNGRPYHAGVIKEGNDIYYISEKGIAVKGTHIVYTEMTNDILKHGTYTFGEDYKLIPETYIAPKKNKKHKNSKHSKNKIKAKFKAKIKANTKTKIKIEALMRRIYIIASVILVVATVCVGIAVVKNRPNKVSPTETSNASKIILPTFEKDIPLCSNEAMKLYDGEITVKQAVLSGNPYRPFKFEYELDGRYGILSVSEYSDMRDAKDFTLPAKNKSITIDNLKTGTTYYYIVTVGEKIYPGSFKTAESTRFINMPGGKNVRDIGGYMTLDGKKVKQGMLIRGTEIDGLVEPSYFLEEDSVDYVKETFGFVCDLDLRKASLFSGNYQTRLGRNVAHKFYDSPMYGSIFSEDFQSSLRQIFADIANPANYPMYLHCTYGADRTGTICFLVEGILNLPEEVMQRDYQLTGFSNPSYASSANFNSIYGGLEGYKGNGIQEKIVNYLTSEVGVTMNQIESIRNILLKD